MNEDPFYFFQWPGIFTGENKIDEIPNAELLAMQLVGWANIQLGVTPPTNCDFYDVMEHASKITGAFTPTECKAVAERIVWERRKNRQT